MELGKVFDQQERKALHALRSEHQASRHQERRPLSFATRVLRYHSYNKSQARQLLLKTSSSYLLKDVDFNEYVNGGFIHTLISSCSC